MIAFLKGMVEDITGNSLVLDVHGVGYEVLVPGQILDLMGGTGQEIKLYTYMQVREDAVILFGFLTKDDLQMFRMLIAVNGVGPKAGLAILSALGADDLRFAVLADDAKRIAKTPGIGAKTAQKSILEQMCIRDRGKRADIKWSRHVQDAGWHPVGQQDTFKRKGSTGAGQLFRTGGFLCGCQDRGSEESGCGICGQIKRI